MTAVQLPTIDNAVKFGKDFAVGGASAAIAKTIIAPLERVKLIIQLQAGKSSAELERHYAGMIDCFIRVPREQGFLSFWRGNWTNILRACSQESLGMAFKELFRPYLVNGIDKKLDPNRFMFANLLAGGLSGCATYSIIYPLDFTRTRLAVDLGKAKADREFLGLYDCYRKITKADGFVGLYRGFLPSLQYIFIYRALYYGLYDTIKSHVEHGGDAIGFLHAFSIGQLTAFIAAMAAYPLDTVRRRLMLLSGKHEVVRMNTLQCIKVIYREEGTKGFFNGAFVNAIRGVGAALVLAFYSEVQKVM